MGDQPRQLATLRQAGELRPLPGLTTDASRRRWGHLVRTGAVPCGVAIRLAGRVYLDLERLDEWLATGGQLGASTEARP